MTLIEICSFAIKEALKEGADEAEGYAILDKESEVFLESSDLKQVKTHSKSSIGIRVVTKDSMGFASVNSLEKENVTNAVRDAVRIARVSPKDKHNSLPARRKVSKLRGIYDRNAENFMAEDAAKQAAEMLASATSYDARISVDSGTFNASLITNAICNSNGVELEEKISMFSWSIMGMAIDGSDVSNFDFQFGGTHRVKKIDVSKAAEEFAKTVVGSLGAKKIDSMKGVMILSPNAVYELLQEVIAFAINSKQVQKGTSRFAKMVGKKVASSNLTLVDDATYVEGLGAESFDREGVPHKRNVIIDKGVLKRFIYNTHTARKDATRSTGNASGSTKSPPSVDTTNIIIENGKHSLDSILGEVRRGIIVNRYSGNINPVNGDFSGVVKGGQLVENGNRTTPVREVMVAGNAFEALKQISHVSKDRLKIFDSFLPYIGIEGISFTGG